MVKEVNDEAIMSRCCAVSHLIDHCFHLLHEQVIVFIVDQRRDVLENIGDSLLERLVWF